MKKRDQFRARDLEKLSAFMDGQLSQKGTARLEARLAQDAELRKLLHELKATRELISSLPKVRPPRQFTLSEDKAVIQRAWNPYPVFRFAAVMATVAFAILVGFDALLQWGPLPTRAVLEAPMVLESEKAIEVAVLVEGTEEVSLERSALPPEDSVLGVAEAPAAPKESADAAEMPFESQGAPEAEEDALTPTPVAEGSPYPTAAGESFVLELPSETPEAKAGEPTAVATVSPAIHATPHPEVEEKPEPLTPLRKLEISVGSAAVLLIGLSLWLRRQR